MGNGQHAEKINVENAADRFRIGYARQSIALFGNARIVNQNVEAAVPGTDRVGRRRDSCRLGDIQLDEMSVTSRRPQ